MTDPKAIKWVKIALFYLVITALTGLIMRVKLAVIFPVFNFNFILHAHSHTAMLGWVYSALYIALLYSYLPEKGFTGKIYSRIFILTQVSIAGMLLTFSLQGYGAFSIAFSTLHVLLSYLFIFIFIKDTRTLKAAGNNWYSLKFVYAGFFFLAVSTIGPWGLAVLAALKLTGSSLYTQAIYFYLHFLYNGFFTFVIIGLWLKKSENTKPPINGRLLNISFILLFFAALPAYFLSLLGFDINYIIKWAGIISAIVQLTGVFILFITLKSGMNVFPKMKGVIKILFYVSFISLIAKFILQSLSAVPLFTSAVFAFRDIVIGYLHLVLLGFVTCGLMSWFAGAKLMEHTSAFSKISVLIFLAGFVLSEILLFAQIVITIINLSVIPYHTLLLTASALMFAGILMIWLKQLVFLKEV